MPQRAWQQWTGMEYGCPHFATAPTACVTHPYHPPLQASEGVAMGLLLRVLTETWVVFPLHCPHPTRPRHLAQMNHDACKVEVMHIWLICRQRTRPYNTLQSFSNVKTSYSCLISTFLQATLARRLWRNGSKTLPSYLWLHSSCRIIWENTLKFLGSDTGPSPCQVVCI